MTTTTRPSRLRTLALAASLACATRGAAACPVCDTETGEQVRAGIAGPDFAFHLAVTLLPFPIFIGIAAAVHFGLPWGRNAQPAGTRADRETQDPGGRT